MKTFGRRAWTKRRGSALVFTSIMMVAITTVVIGTVQVNMVAATKAELRITQALAEQTFDAQTALVTAISKDQSITLPHSFDCLINGYKMTCIVTDNSASELRTVKLTAVGTFKGKRFRYTRIIGGRQTTHPFYYALWTERGLDTTTTPITTSTGSNIYIKGNATLGATSSLGGDVHVTGTVTNAATIENNLVDAAITRTPAAVPLADLRTEGGSLLDLLGWVVSLTLPGTLSNGHYSLNYYKNANEISGVFGGKGTLVFEKNVKVTGDVVYLNGSSRMVYIVNGNLDIDKTVNQIDGFWYVTGQIKAKGTTNTLYVGRGALFSGTDIMSDRPINVTFDNAFWVDRVEAQRHCVPGFWPTPETGIMR